jgi:hypothetical protein
VVPIPSRLASSVVLAAVSVLVWQAPAARAEQDSGLAAVVASASRWAAGFEESLSGLLFRERYLQKADGLSSIPGARRQRSQQVRLEANVFLLRPAPAAPPVLFRDVYAVNGRAVGDHTERLRKLLTAGSAEAIEQARRLTDASAGYNLGPARRNINIPTMAFAYVLPGRVAGTRFAHAGEARINRLPTVMIDFEEAARPSLVRSASDGDVPAKGRYWIDPASGAILQALMELDAPSAAGRLQIEVAWSNDLGMWVPRRMTEVWQALGEKIVGDAEYDRFQRLVVTIDGETR